METKDKRVKREIANSNERRRMQSINSGFQKLKRLLPVNDGEKLSKAAILQRTSEFIQQSELEKLLLRDQNTLFRELLSKIKGGTDISVLEKIDLDALPTIPANTRINNVTHDNSNTSEDSTSSTGKEVHKKDDDSSFRDIGAHINDKDTYLELDNHPITRVTEVTSDKNTSPKNGLASAGVAKAAIALPLEVPYYSETAIRSDQHHNELHPDVPPSTARKMLRTDQTTINPVDPAPKGQTLDTICKAIMEIEGDRVFNEKIKTEAT